MKRICGWCRCDLPPRPDLFSNFQTEGLRIEGEIITHGICPECNKKQIWLEWLWYFQCRAMKLSDEELDEKHWSFYVLSQRCKGNERLLQCADVLLDEKFRRVRVEIEGC